MLLKKINIDSLNKVRNVADLVGSEYQERNWDLFTILVLEGSQNLISKLIQNKGFEELCKNHEIWIYLDFSLLKNIQKLLHLGVKKLVIPFNLKNKLNIEIPNSKLIWKFNGGLGDIEGLKNLSSECKETINTPYLNSLPTLLFDLRKHRNSVSKINQFLGKIKSFLRNPIIIDPGKYFPKLNKEMLREFRIVLNLDLIQKNKELENILVDSLDFDKMGGLIPTIVRDSVDNILMLAYSSKKSLIKAIKLRQGVYFSRSRNKIWVKGETSGNGQELINIKYDCDKDALLFKVIQKNFACHLGTYSCFQDEKFTMESLYQIIKERIQTSSEDESFTKKIGKNKKLLLEKIREESLEVLNYENRDNLIWEIADLTYFTLILMYLNKISPNDIMNELWRRTK